SKSRGADHWSKDDYDVRLDDARGPVVGRIMRHPQAPQGQPWFWTITARGRPQSITTGMQRAVMRQWRISKRAAAWRCGCRQKKRGRPTLLRPRNALHQAPAHGLVG